MSQLFWIFSWGMTPFITSSYFFDFFVDVKFLAIGICLFTFLCPLLVKNNELIKLKIPKGFLPAIALGPMLVLYLVFILPSQLLFLCLITFAVTLFLFFLSKINSTGVGYFDKVSETIVLSSIAALLFGFFQFIYCHLNPIYFESQKIFGFFSGGFGNINIFAQYLALTLPFSLYLLFHSNSKPLEKKLYLMISTAIVFLVALTMCRSASLAVLASLLCFGIQRRVKFQKLLMVLGLVFFTHLVLVPRLALDYETQRATKASSFHIRMELLQSGFRIFKSTPSGIGVGQYRFNTFPMRYKGTTYFKKGYNDMHPHNEPLKWFIELGAIGGFCYILLWIYIFLKYFFRVRRRFGEYDALMFSLIVTLGLESFFQFPTDVVHPYLIFSLVLAAMAWRVLPKKRAYLGTIPRSVLGFICICSVVIFGYSTFSRSEIEKSFPSVALAVCKIQLLDWRRCLWLSRNIRSYEPKKSEAILDSLLYRNPFNAHLVGEKSLIAKRESSKKLQCIGFALQKKIFAGETYFPLGFVKECEKQSSYDTLSAMDLWSQWLEVSGVSIHPVYQATLKNSHLFE